MSDLIRRGRQAHRFVDVLFPPGRARGYANLRLLNSRTLPAQRWYDIATELPQFEWPWFIERTAPWETFIGLATRRARGSGGRLNCWETWVLIVDYDGKSAEEAARFEQQLRGFRPEPTMVVKSGSPHARHVYWKLHTPVVFMDDAGAIRPDVEERYQRTVLGLAHHFGSDPAVADTPRVIRMPGTVNHKPGRGGAVATLLDCQPELQYALEDFAEWLAPAPVPSGGTAQPAGRRGRENGSFGDEVDLLGEIGRRGWLLCDQGSDMWFIKCPWQHQHTTRSGVTETMLWRWDDRWCFRCMHGHCAERRIAHVYEYVRIERELARLDRAADARQTR